MHKVFSTGGLTGARLQIDCLAQDCSNSSALAMELLQSCTKPWDILDYSQEIKTWLQVY